MIPEQDHERKFRELNERMASFEDRISLTDEKLNAVLSHTSDWFNQVKHMLLATTSGNFQARREQWNVPEILFLFEAIGFRRLLIQNQIPDTEIGKFLEGLTGYSGENFRRLMNNYTLKNRDQDDITEPKKFLINKLREDGLTKIADLLESKL